VVHRRVGVPEQRLAARTPVDRHGDPDRGADDVLDVARAQRLLEDVEQAVGELLGALAAVDVSRDHDELVAAEARQHVTGTQRAGQATCDGPQDVVARTMAERVVHDLELVEVDEQHRDVAPASSTGRAEDQVEAPTEEGAVRQPGQRVVVGVMAARPLGLAQVRDVRERDEDLGQHPAVVAHGDRVDAEPHPAAVRAMEPDEDAELWLARLEHALDGPIAGSSGCSAASTMPHGGANAETLLRSSRGRPRMRSALALQARIRPSAPCTTTPSWRASSSVSVSASAARRASSRRVDR
jgi:hypothetical protein